MGKILEMDFFSISFYKIKDFLKRNKKRIFFIGLLLILFFILFENGLADPATDPKVDSKNLASKLGEMVDKFFEQIMTQLAIMIAKLSSAVLAITALLFIIDVLLKVMGALGDFNLWSFLGASLQGFIMFCVIMFLLMPTSHTVTAGGVSAAINNYQLITMGTPDFKQKSLLTGFLEMGKQFFADDKNLAIDTPTFSSPLTKIFLVTPPDFIVVPLSKYAFSCIWNTIFVMEYWG